MAFKVLIVKLQAIVLGVFSDRVTPDPIPNSAVKPVSADGSLALLVLFYGENRALWKIEPRARG